ncbi:MAG TPA: hypothetical protein DEF47_23955 [Herpetosiphon sp.]|uniref:Uncharacterized protein n=1 Tax=Herpetosiphon aurantiacus (strain ATCC 23779 / DSM 785 / 114-95) TaxID=316274 RepID=A9AXP8_HERA2|nr:hypothetical protein [Herpetosiphon sp.]ABX03462.1 hypothetical protein Haur_0814 [Herpetosiphon aurantiacus DSM 785]HBW52949.1 hypothetical protein [Herpetosiphon sp.]
MDYLGLIALFAGIFGLTGYAGLLLRQAIGLYRQRPDLRRTLRPVLLNLIEPFVSLLYLIPCMLWWDYGYLLSLVGSDFAAGSIVFAYHWPMQLLLVYAPFGWMFARQKMVARTAWLCFALGVIRVTMLWLCFNYSLGGGMIVLALIVGAATFWLLGRYLQWQAIPPPQIPIMVNIDEQGLVLIQPIEPNQAHQAEL